MTPLLIEQLPIDRRGLTSFSFTRYLVPWLNRYQGHALFLDSDMLCLGDIAELLEHCDETPLKVVKNKQKFEWPSLMLFNCEACDTLTPERVDDPKAAPELLKWADSIGDLPAEWNHCVGYDEPLENAKLVHFTQGIPFFAECRDVEYAKAWRDEFQAVTGATVSWLELMGPSRHLQPVLDRLKCA